MTELETSVYCTTRFEEYHCWPDAPEAVSHLRNLHRHLFHVKVEVSVDHDDRDVEFQLLKRQVEQSIERIKDDLEDNHWSCEAFAAQLFDRVNGDFACRLVEVTEDGENGAIVRRQ